MILKAGMEKAVDAVVAEISKMAKKVQDADVAKVATISAQDEKIGSLIAEALSKVGKDNTWEELKNHIWASEEKFGASWIELIWDQNDEEILDLGILDPKCMDYPRDGNGNIILDDNQKPIGYIMKLSYGVRAEGQGDKVPDKWKNISFINSKWTKRLVFRDIRPF